MTEHLYPALFALFVWWFSTGVIIYLDGLPQKTFKWSMIGATAIMAVSLFGLYTTANDTSLQGVYLAFTYGLLAWGWQEISFYMGYVTGPRKEPCPDDCHGIKHFWHGVEVGLWHELAIIVAFAAVVWLTWGGENLIGLWTFAVLWWMHQSAKLNVFFGVRNLNEEFLPDHLAYLKRYLNKRAMNLLFPVSVTVSTVICVMLFDTAFAADATPYEATGYTFLGVLMALAILEHWFLVLPLPAGKLWHWGLKSRGADKPFDLEIATGFLGSGKTTFLNRRLVDADPDVKTVALVNDFANLGLDGSLLSEGDADVVELPNGCICCSLKKDLGDQIREIVNSYAPDRILIEPSGVADTASLMAVLNQPEIARLTRSTILYGIIDGGAFLTTFAKMPDYFRVQASLNPVFIINKTDLIDDAVLHMIEDTLVGLNPMAEIQLARHGAMDTARMSVLSAARPPASSPETASALPKGAVSVVHRRPDHQHDRDDDLAHAHKGHHHHSDPASAMNLTSFSAHLNGSCDARPLRELLESIVSGAYGSVERVKGLARSGDGWLRFDVAGGRPSITAFAAREDEVPRVVAIGNRIDQIRLEAAFAACRTD